MKTQVYESALLINAALDDTQIESIINRVKDTIQNNSGEIREIEDWGRKRLAYMINKSKIGYYAIFRFEAPSDFVAKLERMYSLDEQILRYLTISLSKEALEQLEKNKAQSTSNNDDNASANKPEKEKVEEATTDSEEKKDNN